MDEDGSGGVIATHAPFLGIGEEVEEGSFAESGSAPEGEVAPADDLVEGGGDFAGATDEGSRGDGTTDGKGVLGDHD